MPTAWYPGRTPGVVLQLRALKTTSSSGPACTSPPQAHPTAEPNSPAHLAGGRGYEGGPSRARTCAGVIPGETCAMLWLITSPPGLPLGAPPPGAGGVTLGRLAQPATQRAENATLPDVARAHWNDPSRPPSTSVAAKSKLPVSTERRSVASTWSVAASANVSDSTVAGAVNLTAPSVATNPGSSATTASGPGVAAPVPAQVAPAVTVMRRTPRASSITSTERSPSANRNTGSPPSAVLPRAPTAPAASDASTMALAASRLDTRILRCA